MLASLLGRGERRGFQISPWGNWNSAARMSTAGVNVTTDTALQLLTVYGCVSLIADTIATLPRDVFRSGDQRIQAPAPPWLEQPNQTHDIVEFITQVITSLLLDGNAYLAYSLDRAFVTNEVHALDPALVEVHTDNDTITYWVKGKQFHGRLLHVKAFTRPGAVKGVSPIESARQAIGLGLAAQDYASTFYSNGANLGGVIQVPGEMTPDQATILKDKWSRDHSGLRHAHEPGVLTGGATWSPVSVTPEQAEFLGTRKYQAAEISAQMFRVDPTLLGIAIEGKGLTYANLEQRGVHFVQFTLLPWIIRLERAFSFLLPKPHQLKFNVAGLERADLFTRYQAYALATAGQPWFAPNEVRALEDLSPVNGGDELAPPKQPTTPPPAAAAPPEAQQ